MMINQKFGIQADLADDGQMALDKFKAKNNLERLGEAGKQKKPSSKCLGNPCPKSFYQLIFMDLQMPVMDGFNSSTKIMRYQNEKLAQAIKSKALPACNIVALTAYVNNDNIKKC
mmetsp:Transcript_9267/g.15592  ORF Transcript_9267/g.15592 Transcript_9267/m.15592 type:complete len:115 (+) Transcript_9267:723-1067(+)